MDKVKTTSDKTIISALTLENKSLKKQLSSLFIILASAMEDTKKSEEKLSKTKKMLSEANELLKKNKIKTTKSIQHDSMAKVSAQAAEQAEADAQAEAQEEVKAQAQAEAVAVAKAAEEAQAEAVAVAKAAEEAQAEAVAVAKAAEEEQAEAVAAAKAAEVAEEAEIEEQAEAVEAAEAAEAAEEAKAEAEEKEKEKAKAKAEADSWKPVIRGSGKNATKSSVMPSESSLLCPEVGKSINWYSRDGVFYKNSKGKIMLWINDKKGLCFKFGRTGICEYEGQCINAHKKLEGFSYIDGKPGPVWPENNEGLTVWDK
jgi:glucan-binding YG repeat protein